MRKLESKKPKSVIINKFRTTEETYFEIEKIKNESIMALKESAVIEYLVKLGIQEFNKGKRLEKKD